MKYILHGCLKWDPYTFMCFVTIPIYTWVGCTPFVVNQPPSSPPSNFAHIVTRCETPPVFPPGPRKASRFWQRFRGIIKQICWCVANFCGSVWVFQRNLAMFHENLGCGFEHVFTTTWGNNPIWRAYFSTGLVQPPTRHSLFWNARAETRDERQQLGLGSASNFPGILRLEKPCEPNGKL